MNYNEELKTSRMKTINRLEEKMVFEKLMSFNYLDNYLDKEEQAYQKRIRIGYGVKTQSRYGLLITKLDKNVLELDRLFRYQHDMHL